MSAAADAMRRLALLATLALTGCSITKDVPLANKAIDAFHHSLDAGEFAGIYDASAQDMKNTTTKDGFVQLLTAIHRKLGAFRNGRSTNWNDNYGSGGHLITVIYEATYDKGPAHEEFVYRIDGERASLAGYHVNSNALILN
jgi:hypothetical protein